MKVKIVTQREMIKTLPSLWKEFHCASGDIWQNVWSEGTNDFTESSEEIYNKLLQLDLNKCDVSEVIKIMGTTEWVTIDCACCDNKVTEAIEVMEENEILFHNPIYVCGDCVKKFAKAFKLI